MLNKIKKISLLFLSSMIIVCYILPTKVFAFGPSSNIIYQGIDVSGYQGNINFREVKEAGIDIVYIKSSEGSNYIDSHFESHYDQARPSA